MYTMSVRVGCRVRRRRHLFLKEVLHHNVNILICCACYCYLTVALAWPIHHSFSRCLHSRSRSIMVASTHEVYDRMMVRRRGLSSTTKNEEVTAVDNINSCDEESQHLVLIGGGHAHIQVVKALHRGIRPSHLRVTLIDAQFRASYSGMIPGCIAGFYEPSETQVALEPLAEWAGVTFVHARVVDLDLSRREVVYEHITTSPQSDESSSLSFRNEVSDDTSTSDQSVTRTLSFDVVSLDIGSAAKDWVTIPGAQQFTIPTRPIDELVKRVEQARLKWHETSPRRDSSPQLVIVGGGAAGLELSLAVVSRWKISFPDLTCTVIEAGSELLPNEQSLVVRRKLDRVLRENGVSVKQNCFVRKVLTDHLHVCHDGNDITVPFTHCIWATGAGPSVLALKLANQRGQHLDMTVDGWIQVYPTLQSTSHPFVFAAGDCASMVGTDSPPPKAGVYAVRSGPILIENLTRYLDYLMQSKRNKVDIGDSQRSPLLPYQPQDDFLKLLVCGRYEALGFRFGLALRGHWVWKLKDHIDRTFMNLFDPAFLPPAPNETKSDEEANGHIISGSSSSATGRYDTSEYDASADALPGELLSPDEAATLLMREDDGVDYLLAWKILRAMARDDSYRESVASSYNQLLVEAKAR